MINLAQVSDIEFADVDPADYPDFADAFIASATIAGREATEAELDELNANAEFVQTMLHKDGMAIGLRH